MPGNFSRKVLGITSGISDLGGMQWELLGTLVMAWLVVYLIIMKGLHASGKVNNNGSQVILNLHANFVRLFGSLLCFHTLSSSPCFSR